VTYFVQQRPATLLSLGAGAQDGLTDALVLNDGPSKSLRPAPGQSPRELHLNDRISESVHLVITGPAGLEPCFAVGEILLVGVGGQFCLERGHQEANRGSGQAKSDGHKHESRVARASLGDELGMQGAEIAQVGGYDRTVLTLSQCNNLQIGQPRQVGMLLDRLAIVAACAQGSRDRG
jgi:hypothetical protein